MTDDTHAPGTAAMVLPQAAGALADEQTFLQEAERRLAVWEGRRQLVLRVLNSTDVNRMGNRLAKNRYAAEKLLTIFGGKVEVLKDPEGRPIIEKTMIDDDPDMGRLVIFTTFTRYSRPDGIVFEAAGSFSSKDPFFAKDSDAWRPFSEVNLADVLSAAFTESFKKAVFRGCGLGDFDDVEQGKVLAASAAGHDFKGSKKITDDDPAVTWGDAKGKRVSELSAKDLDFYLTRTKASIADPRRAQHRATNERMAAAIEARIAALKGEGKPATTADEAPARVDPESGEVLVLDGGAPAAEQPAPTRGQLITLANERLVKLFGRAPKAHAEALRALTAAWGEGEPRGQLSALTVEELQRFVGLTEEALADILKHA